MNQKAREPQNQSQFDDFKKSPGLLGPYSTHIWKNDPKHLSFLLSRYKFVAKMLEGMRDVLEIGCGDGFGIPVVAQTVQYIHAVDWEPLLMEDNRKRISDINCSFECMDITLEKPTQIFDAAYLLDVIEHISPQKEHLVFENIVRCLNPNGVCIVGTPNKTAEQYASKASKEGHINLKTHEDLKKGLSLYFHNVFMFSMNDEVLHTGFAPMSHYLLAMGVGTK